MAVPLLDLKPQNLALERELCETFQRVLRSGQYILGPELEEFEASMARFLGVRHAIGVSSGTDALLLGLMSLGIGVGDEVLVPSFTFFATAGCVRRVGATPIFADVCPVCFNLDVADAAGRLTRHTKAVMPVHVFGQSAGMDEVMTFARAHGLRVIEDGAQALGARSRGQAVGGMGDFGAFSFFPTKNLGALGDAGLLVTNDGELAEKARLMRVHGAKPRYFHHVIGANFRMDPLQAALLSVKLPHYQEYTERRKTNAADYSSQLSKLPGAILADATKCGGGDRMPPDGENARLVLPQAHASNEHIWNQYTIRVPGSGRRDALRQCLAEKGIGTEIYYPVPLHAQPCFQPSQGMPPRLPVSERLAGEVVSLPIYPELTAPQRAEVVSAIARHLILMTGN